MLLRNAPARKRFYVCVILLVTWITPWHLLQLEVTPSNIALPENFLLNLDWVHTNNPPANITLEQLKNGPQKTSYTWSWGTLLLSAFVIGIILFLRDIRAYLKLNKKWYKQSHPDNNNICKKLKLTTSNYQIRRIAGYGPGMTTGLLTKVIWLDAKQQDLMKLEAIVLHELTHIRQHDPYWLWVINLLQRLFWWNPIVTLTAQYAQQQIELSCDEQCQRSLPTGVYQQQLITLTLDENKQQKNVNYSGSKAIPTILQISNSQAFNLQRIYKLNEIPKRKKRYSLIFILLLSIIGWIGFSNATVNQISPSDDVSFIAVLEKPIEAYKNDKIDLAFSLFQKPLASISSYTASEKAQIWMYYTKVLFKKDFTDPEILTYLDKAIALGDSLPTKQLLSLLSMANSRALSQRNREKQISYLERWFDLAGDEHKELEKKSYMAAVANFSLKNYSTTINLLNRIIDKNAQQNKPVNEMWLTLLVASYKKNGQLLKAYDALQDLAIHYPNEKRQKQLKQLSNRLNTNGQ
jgi:beta-lactamase regulating signal transducer with metallopeptidase domain